jgi:hypothetical protein
MQYYNSLNDAPLPELQPGPAKVWYAKPGPAMDLAYGQRNASQYRGVVIDPANMEKTHVLLGEIAGAGTLEQVWMALQGENWSPNGEARNLIERLGLSHTSMSIGDCIEVDGRVMMVEFCGWGQVAQVSP